MKLYYEKSDVSVSIEKESPFQIVINIQPCMARHYRISSRAFMENFQKLVLNFFHKNRKKEK